MLASLLSTVSRFGPKQLRAHAISALTTSGRRPSSMSTDPNSWPQLADPEDRSYLHHGSRPRFRDYVKFKSPRKRASKLLHELNQEAVEKSKQSNPAVWETQFSVGDAIEVEWKHGTKSRKVERWRGVVIGIFRKLLDSSVLIRDVVYGHPIERRIPLHSPLVKSLKVLTKNFVYKGRRKVKRAKLYFLRERNPLGKFI